MDNLQIFGNFLDVNTINSVIKTIFTEKWSHFLNAYTGVKEDDTNIFNISVTENRLFMNEIKAIIEYKLNTKVRITDSYITIQPYGHASKYHVDTNDDDERYYTLCIYINKVNNEDIPDAGGHLFIKTPDSNFVTAIEPFMNRAILFPSNYLHKAMPFNRHIVEDRYAIVYKLKLLDSEKKETDNKEENKQEENKQEENKQEENPNTHPVMVEREVYDEDEYFKLLKPKDIPKILYNITHDKKNIKHMINTAIQNGLQAFDTVFNLDSDAEEITGDHLLSLYRSSSLTREHVFLQAKYTPLFNRKDLSFENYVKYYANMTLESQVNRSFYRILRKLRTSKIDALLLHYPMPHFQDTLIIWNEFEKLANNGEVDYLGLSNCYDIKLLTTIWERANIKPRILQNNYCKEHSYDKEIRVFCKEHDIIYQSYSAIPSNKEIVNNNLIIELSKTYSKTPQQIWLSYLSQKNINIITGTNTEEYMKDNIDATLNINLNENEIKEIDNIVYGD